MLLKDRVVIITGSGKGIGKDAALKFAAEGASVVVASRTPAEIESVAAEIKAAGGTALAVPTDISVPERVEQMVAETIKAFGQVDVMVNNAAYPGPWKELVDLEYDEWDAVQNTNIRGSMSCCKHVLPHMIARKSGSIINVSSTAGRRGLARKTHYSTSKFALIGFTRALAMEVGKHNIRVNCIVPGAIMTDLLTRVFEREAREQGITPEESKARAAAASPMERIVEPNEVADLMVFLGSDLSRGIHGQSIDINAGSFMA